MIFGFTQHFLDLSDIEYRVLYGVVTVICGYLLGYSYATSKRYRFIDATATSKIRAAAQGQVELKGLAEWLVNGVIESPFSKQRCVWYHSTIEQKQRSGNRTSWTSLVDNCSNELFRLVDETGDCIIDPERAYVIPECDLVWYGRDIDTQFQKPAKRCWHWFGSGHYRFRERLIRPASEIYVLGWFQSASSDPPHEFVSAQVDELLRQWKLQPQRYLQHYDQDHNGSIQKKEWKVIKAAAHRQVIASLEAEKREHHVISRAPDTRQPFILSAISEEVIVRRQKWRARASLLMAFAIFCLLVVLYALRNPLPV